MVNFGLRLDIVTVHRLKLPLLSVQIYQMRKMKFISKETSLLESTLKIRAVTLKIKLFPIQFDDIFGRIIMRYFFN